MVSRFHRDGRGRSGTAEENGKVLEEAQARNGRTLNLGVRARLVVLVAAVGPKKRVSSCRHLFGPRSGRSEQSLAQTLAETVGLCSCEGFLHVSVESCPGWFRWCDLCAR